MKDRVVHKAEMKNIRIHDFRHTHGSMLLENKVSVKKVQMKLGHSKPTITLDIYSSLLDEIDDTGDTFQKISKK